jgi:hypothetical protein
MAILNTTSFGRQAGAKADMDQVRCHSDGDTAMPAPMHLQKEILVSDHTVTNSDQFTFQSSEATLLNRLFV